MDMNTKTKKYIDVVLSGGSKGGPSEYVERDNDVVTINKEKLKLPPRYKVLMHNDDYTTMEFVVLVLKVIFGKNEQSALKIMLDIHLSGLAICGIYTYEIAETKVAKVYKMAKDAGHPLKTTIEQE